MDDVLELISQIGKQESSLKKRTFISPVFDNTVVATRVEGMVYTFKIPQTAEGWYQIRPKNKKEAKIVGPAELPEIEGYMKYLEKVRIVLVMKQKGLYLGIPDKINKFGFKMNELQPIYLCDDSPLDFDRVIARFDGANLWFERIDQSNDPSKADYLRTSMIKLVQLEKIKYSGLTVEEKHAYAMRMAFDKKFVADLQKDTLKKDVEFAGGKFQIFVEKKDHYSVTYTVDGQSFTSFVSKDPRHMVITAGLCLAGGDRKFDLKSLVTVIREAQHERVVHVGNFGPDHYDWDED
jgi:hypothetical protein